MRRAQEPTYRCSLPGLAGFIGVRRRHLGWRRGWDLNPRQPCDCTRFPGVPLRPLGHLSQSSKPAPGPVCKSILAKGQCFNAQSAAGGKS